MSESSPFAVRYVPLILAAAFNLAAACYAVPRANDSLTIELVAWTILFPTHLFLVAVWAGVQAEFWRRLPWAIMAGAAIFGGYLWGTETSIEITASTFPTPLSAYLMPLPTLLAAVGLCLVIRTFAKRASQPSKLGLRFLFLCTAAMGVSIAVIQYVVRYQGSYMMFVFEYAPENMLYYGIIAAEYFALAAPLAIFIVRFWFLRCLPWFTCAYFPLVIFAEAFVILGLPETSLTDAPFVIDPEGIAHAIAMSAIFSITLLAWRHSGLLVARNDALALEEATDVNHSE